MQWSHSTARVSCGTGICLHGMEKSPSLLHIIILSTLKELYQYTFERKLSSESNHKGLRIIIVLVVRKTHNSQTNVLDNERRT